MGLEPELLALMPHTIEVYLHEGFNDYGEPSYSTAPTLYRAMVEEKPNMVRDMFGEEVVSSHVAYVASTARIPATARVVLPDGSEPPLIRASAYYDESGDIHHINMFFGSGAANG